MITGSATLRAVRTIGAHESIDADDIGGVGVVDCHDDTVQLYSKGPLAESLNAFLRSLEGKNRSELTRKAYHTDVTEFLSACTRRRLSGLSRARKLAALREYYRYLVDHEFIVEAPTNGIETPKKEHNVRKFLVPHEYNTVLVAAAGNSRDYAIYQVFLQTGLRVSELCALRLDDLELNARPYALLHVRLGEGDARPYNSTRTEGRAGAQELSRATAREPE